MASLEGRANRLGSYTKGSDRRTCSRKVKASSRYWEASDIRPARDIQSASGRARSRKEGPGAAALRSLRERRYQALGQSGSREQSPSH